MAIIEIELASDEEITILIEGRSNGIKIKFTGVRLEISPSSPLKVTGLNDIASFTKENVTDLNIEF